MRFRIQIVVETEAGSQVQEIVEIAGLERNDHRLAEVGLTLAESKRVLADIQKIVVEQQVSEYLEGQRRCPCCGKVRGVKSSHRLTFQTLFGNLEIGSPRWNHCRCQPNQTKTFSPLLGLLHEHVSPERLYLESKWASLISIELTAQLLKDTLPIVETINAATVRNHLHLIAERAEEELGEEQGMFVDGCPRDWAALPCPPAPLTVGIDGCYVRHWEDKKAHFEVIVGKVMAEEEPSRCFGFVQTYDEKPKRRLFELLKGQGMQMNQRVMFFSDGGADIRDLQLYLNPEAEHYLDWFHVTMRLTVMGQYAKGLEISSGKREELLKLLESTKHYLWHGNVYRARDRIEDTLDFLDSEEVVGDNLPKLRKALEEFDQYIKVNQARIPNYGERWRNQEAIATGFVESAVNQIVSKRFCKKQQMQWTKKGAHLLLQMRTQVLDDRLEQTFRGWYTGFRPAENNALSRVA
jgi:hypothetical protein